MSKSCQKLPNSDFQSQFSTSRIIRIILKKISSKNIILEEHFFLLTFFKYFDFGTTLFSKMTFNFWQLLLKNFLMGWLLVLGLKEDLVECATVCVKSEVILLQDINLAPRNVNWSSYLSRIQITSHHCIGTIHVLRNTL